MDGKDSPEDPVSLEQEGTSLKGTEEIGAGMKDARPLRLLHLVPKFSRSNDLIHNTIGRIDPGCFASLLCYLDRNPGKVKEDLCPVHSMGRSHQELRRFSFSLIRRLGALIDEERVDLIHCHRHKAALYGTLAARRSRRKIPVVVTVHGMRRTRTFLRRLTNRFLFPRIAAVLAVSEAVRKDLLRTNPGLDPAKVSVVRNGIDLSQFPLRRRKMRGESGPVFGTVGRLAPTKGYDLLLQAMASLLPRFPKAEFRLAGAGPLEGPLKEEASRLGIRDRVIFAGFVKEVPSFLKDLDFFILPSRAEGLPLALLEAMAVGVPVIASSAGGIPEVLNDPGCGLLFPVGSVESLEQTMVKAAEFSQGEYQERVTAARKRVEDVFSLERMVRELEGIYADVLSSPIG